MVIYRGHGCVCLHKNLTHAWVQIFGEVFRYAIERFFLSEYGMVMIAPPNAAPCSEDTPRDISRC